MRYLVMPWINILYKARVVFHACLKDTAINNNFEKVNISMPDEKFNSTLQMHA